MTRALCSVSPIATALTDSGTTLRLVGIRSLLGVFLFVVITLAGYPQKTSAAVLLRYSGEDFVTIQAFGVPPPDVYTTADSVEGRLVLADPLDANLVGGFVTPLAYQFSDGVNTIIGNAADAEIESFQFWTDSSGSIVNWAVNIFDWSSDSRSIIQTIFLPGTLGTDAGQSVVCGNVDCIDSSGNVFPGLDPLYTIQARNDETPGTWRIVPVPEPATLVLLGIGLAGLAVSRRKRRVSRHWRNRVEA